jgi:predicted DNA-binding transcriptional regulator YafY
VAGAGLPLHPPCATVRARPRPRLPLQAGGAEGARRSTLVGDASTRPARRRPTRAVNRVDRLFGYVLALQGGPRTAAALAQRFEVSRRTAYRDLQALSELGVPIVAAPGRGYGLMPGYQLPPVMLTAAEAAILGLAGGLFRHFVAHDGRTALETALAKLDAVLPERTRAEAAAVRRRVSVAAWPHRAAPLDAGLPRLVQRAIAERRRLSFVYHARSTGCSRECTVEPHALVYYAGDWHLLARCVVEGAVRQFRLSRMEAPRLRHGRYELPPGADAGAFWANNAPGRTGERVARVLFPPETARWVRERRHYAWEAETETAAGLEVTLRVDRWEELLPWLLGWGGQFRVLAPPELRALVADAARRTAAGHAGP